MPSRVVGGLVSLFGIGCLSFGFHFRGTPQEGLWTVGIMILGLVCLILGVGTAAGNRWLAYALSGLLVLSSIGLGVTSISIGEFQGLTIGLIFTVQFGLVAWIVFQAAKTRA